MQIEDDRVRERELDIQRAQEERRRMDSLDYFESDCDEAFWPWEIER